MSIDVVRRAEELLASGWGAYRVANKLAIDVSTVYRIKDGTHFLQLKLEETLPRCPTCGGRVLELPCRLCMIRRAGL